MDLAILMGTNYISQHLKLIKTFHQSYTWILNTTCSCLRTTLINFFLIHFKCWLLHIKLQKFYKRNTNSINIWAYSTAWACKSMVEKDLLEEKMFCFTSLKGYSIQKWKFYHHLLSLKFISSAEHKRNIFWRTIGTLAPLTSILCFSMEVNGAKHLFGSNCSSKYLPLCSAEERNSRASKWWQNFHFWVAFPFKTQRSVADESWPIHYIL